MTTTRKWKLLKFFKNFSVNFEKKNSMASPGAARRFQLCTIEPTTDISGDKLGVNGTLVLSRFEEIFQLQWTPSDDITTAHFLLTQSANSAPKEDKWIENAQFRIDCSQVSTLQLHHSPLSLSISRIDLPGVRTFSFTDTEFISMTELVEQLIIYGIAVPSPGEPYSLEFYRRCHRGVYPYTPPHIQLNVDATIELPRFWDCLHSFFQTLITHLDSSDTLPKDPQFPLASAARAAHHRVLKQIDDESAARPTYPRVTAAEFDDLFDENGRLKDGDSFCKRLFDSGIDPEVLPRALPFVFGVFSLDSTKQERESLTAELNDEFKSLMEQALSYKEQQIENNKKLSGAFRVIKHDVSRTDRQLAAFKNQDAPGLKMVTMLLKTYCIFNPPIGYLQGMNDLFVPILLSFLPNWNQDGCPVDNDGNIINHEPYLPQIFWCFDAMLRNTDHLKLLANVTEQCQFQADGVFNILNKVSPLAAIWMRRNGLNGLLWCYSDFVLLFKRSFPQIWSVWLQLNCSPYPANWLTYFVAAIIVRGFDQLAVLPDVSITTMMDAFPKILQSMNMETLGKTALWLAEKVPPKSKAEGKKEPEIQMSNFHFFETKWTGPCLSGRDNVAL